MVKVRAEVVATFGVETVTAAMPAAATNDAGTCACSVPPLRNVVASALPCHRTTDCPVKCPPFTVSVNAAAPLRMEEGLRLLAFG